MLQISSVQLLEGGRSLFVEIPELEPVMLCYLRMHLKDAEGVPFKTDLFASPMYPQPYYSFEGAQPRVTGKPTEIAMRVKESKKKSPKSGGKKIKGAKELVVHAVNGLKYQQTLLEVEGWAVAGAHLYQ